MSLTLIHNPTAGDDEQPSKDELLRLMRHAGYDVVYQSTQEDQWDHVLHEASDLVVAAGGDGLVGRVGKRLIGRQTPMAILPLGTANNIARTIGLLDMSLTDLMAGWTTARRMKYDVGIARGPWGSTFFLEGVGVGLFTETMARLDATGNDDLADTDQAKDQLRSVLDILHKQLQHASATPLKVTLDGRRLEDAYVLLEAMNIRSIGPNLALAPAADPGDGLLDIVLVPQGAQDHLQRYLSDCKEGKEGMLNLPVYKSHRVQMVWDGWPIRIDDDVWPEHGAKLSTSPARIDVQVYAEPLWFLAPA
jgi:diacylglycerol kinase family enzyme